MTAPNRDVVDAGGLRSNLRIVGDLLRDGCRLHGFQFLSMRAFCRCPSANTMERH
jgi:hypothetical protein